jgi:hypothetical protein
MKRESEGRPGMVAYACNPSYLRGRGKEDCGSRLGQANSFQDPISIENSGHGGMFLSSQLCREVQIGGSKSRSTWGEGRSK